MEVITAELCKKNGWMLKCVVITEFRVGLKWCDCNVVYNESDSVFTGRLATTFINSTDATAENKLF